MAFNLLKPNVMIDLETIGTHFDSGILSIGAVKFDYAGIHDRFYANVKLSSTKKYGLFIDPETLKWWNEQKPGVIESLFDKAVPLDVALQQFNDWYGTESLGTWSCGADFDQVIMRNAYRAVQMVEPWKYWDGQCYRTLKNLLDDDRVLDPSKNEMAHNALIDAERQAEHMIAMWKIWAGTVESV